MRAFGRTSFVSMLAADANVLIRLLVSDDLVQQRAVAIRFERLLAEGRTVLMSPLALAEVGWVLASVYGYDRSQIADAITALMDTPPLRSQDPGTIRRAIDWYRTGPAGFSDYLLLSSSLAAGAESVLTFDKALLRHPRAHKP